jgi:predicted transcriptional regulator
MKADGKSNRSRSEPKASNRTREELLAKILAIIKSNPGIRPSEINHRLGLEQSDALRDALIKRGLVRKVKEGQATYLYPK